MKQNRWIVRSLALGMALLIAAPAWAHFVWIETQVEGKLLKVRSGFGESDGWDPDLIDRIAATKYWTRSGDSVKELAVPLDAKEKEHRTTIEGARPTMLLGSCDYGVIAFGKRPPTWLRYTAKNLVDPPANWGAPSTNPELRIEVLAAYANNTVKLQVLYLGKPLAEAAIKATPPSGETITLKTDAEGRADWTLVGPGNYGLYVGATVQEPGKKGDQEYAAQSDYTTLTFSVPKSESTPAGK